MLLIGLLPKAKIFPISHFLGFWDLMVFREMCGHSTLQINKLSSRQSRYLPAPTVPTWEELLPEIMLLEASTLCWELLQLDQALHLFMG